MHEHYTPVDSCWRDDDDGGDPTEDNDGGGGGATESIQRVDEASCRRRDGE